MKIVATTSLPAVDRPIADRWNAARSRQNYDEPKNEDDPKKEGNLKSEDNKKHEDDLKTEANLNNGQPQKEDNLYMKTT